MDYLTIVLRTLFIYFVILFVMRLFARREYMSFVVVLMVTQLGVMLMLEYNWPLLVFLIPAVVLIIVQSFYSWYIKKEEQVTETLNLSELLNKIKAEQHHQGLNNEFAELDDLKTIQLEAGRHPLPLIIDGKIEIDNLEKINQTELWLRQELRKLGYREIKTISYCALRDGETFFVELK